jgi:hypothetical protein
LVAISLTWAICSTVDDPVLTRRSTATRKIRRKDMYVKHRNYLRTEKRRGGRRQERERVGAQLSTYNEEDDIFSPD